MEKEKKIQVPILEVMGKEIKDQGKIVKNLHQFYVFMYSSLSFLFTAYATDTTFFLKNQKSVIECYKFSKVSELKPIYQNLKYTKMLEQEKNFECRIVKIENVLKLWTMGDLLIEGKITIFKTLPI